MKRGNQRGTMYSGRLLIQNEETESKVAFDVTPSLKIFSRGTM